MDKYFTIIALSVANLKQYVEFLELISLESILQPREKYKQK